MDINNSNSQNTFLTPTQAAKVINVSLSTLKKFIYSGKIKTLKTPGGHHRIRKDDLLELPGAQITKIQQDFLLGNALMDISEGVINVLEKRQKYHQGHGISVAKLSVKLGEVMGLPHKMVQRLHLAALFHDVGMASISDSILNKEEPLNPNEYSIIKTHPVMGQQIANSIDQFKEISPIILQHHERFDGLGYPYGLSKDAISQEARIIAAAESFVSMTALDSYREPLSNAEALAEIQKSAGLQFDPQVVDAFCKEF